MRPLRLFSIVFNEPYLDWFERGLVPSLCWPKNYQALRAVETWSIWTTPQDGERVRKIAKRVGIPVDLHTQINPSSWADKEMLKPNLRTALVSEMEYCAGKRAFLWVAPDSIFGDGSVASILNLGTVSGICVALAPMRVQAEGFIESVGAGPVSNAELVKLAFEKPHPAFMDAEATLVATNSYESGVSWRKIGEGLYAVTHRKHSAYLMQPTKPDAHWFRNMNKFGSYDHSFPARLVNEQRQRVIGSSDAAFVVELTPATAHRPKCKPADANEPDRFRYNLPNYAANRNVVAIWRAA